MGNCVVVERSAHFMRNMRGSRASHVCGMASKGVSGKSTRLNDTVLEGSMETETVSARTMTSASCLRKSSLYPTWIPR